jgi:hypothetical protein
MKKSITLCVPGCTDIKKVLNEIVVSGTVQEAEIKDEIITWCEVCRQVYIKHKDCHKKPVKLKVTVEVRRERG